MTAAQLRVILNGVAPEAEVVFDVLDSDGNHEYDVDVSSVSVVTTEGGLHGELIREVRLS